MAMQVGPVKLIGTIGGVTFYERDGAYYAQKAGGADKKRIKKDPAFARTRELNREFGSASRGMRLLRRAFVYRTKIADSNLCGRLTGVMVEVVRTDETHLRGQRSVADGKLELLQGFEFHAANQLSKVLRVAYIPAMDWEQQEARVQLPVLEPRKDIDAPQGATHMQLFAVGAVVDFKGGDYFSRRTDGPMVALDQEHMAERSLVVDMTTELQGDWILALGMEFYRLEGDKYLEMGKVERGTMAVVGVKVLRSNV